MMTSKDIFAKRREGAIDEAYQMALQLMGAPKVSDWDVKAFGWCLIDLIKRDVAAGNQQNLAHYHQQLASIKTDPKDEVLFNCTRNALSLCRPQGKLVSDAKNLSKQGKYAEAADVYRKAISTGTIDSETQTSFGWDLYRHTKQLVELEPCNLGLIKRNLSDYLKLDVEKPSLLHTCILQLATKLTGEGKFNMLAFSRLWNLDFLRPEDFERHLAEDGKKYPSLAEKAILQASKVVVSSGHTQDMDYVLPYVDFMIGKFPDNIWFKYNKAKMLLAMGRCDDALLYGIAVAKSKGNDYWAWELLGDIYAGIDPEAALSCYCKALMCPSDDLYTCNLRLKLAQRMVEANDLAASKHEVDKVVAYKNKLAQKIPVDAVNISSQAWYSTIQASKSNNGYYEAKAPAASTLLFSTVPWINANAGDVFALPAKDGRKEQRKQSLIISADSLPLRISVAVSRVKGMNLTPGDGLRVRGEFDAQKRFQIYQIEKRQTDQKWDVFSETVGVVERLNKSANELHFIVDREISGTLRSAGIADAFKEGDAIAMKLFTAYTSENKKIFGAVHAVATEQLPNRLITKQFCEAVRLSNGMGFTSNRIFVPPALVLARQIMDGQKLSGLAVASFDHKRASWGWKAVSIELEPVQIC